MVTVRNRIDHDTCGRNEHVELIRTSQTGGARLDSINQIP
jgi:hypothetical protein